LFVPEQPDFKYTNPEVAEEMDKIMKFWLDLGVDGFRLDGARYIIEEGQIHADTAFWLR
jgi:alpha-glucosidase